jgi:hypothetical protein
MKAMFACVVAAGLMLNAGVGSAQNASSSEKKKSPEKSKGVTATKTNPSKKRRCHYTGDPTGDPDSGESSRNYICD